jgi:hypothetical protein
MRGAWSFVRPRGSRGVMLLTEFVLAKIAEDEESAFAALADDQRGFRPDAVSSGWDHYLRGAGAPGHVLSDCDAKRQIIAAHPLVERFGPEPGSGCVRCDWDEQRTSWRHAGPCETLRILALPFADRTGYDARWQPAWMLEELRHQELA